MTCSIPDCGKPIKHKPKALCNAHYQRWYRSGDPLGSGTALRRPPGLSEKEVFAWYLPGEPPPAEKCWDWPASLNDNGYGQFTANGGHFRAHVVSHSIYNVHDPVTDDRPYVLHSCDRPVCVQPAHLRSGTPAENMADGVSRRRWPIGETHYHAKLSEADVLSIRGYRGRVTETELARRFGVARTTIADVLHGRTWTHLGGTKPPVSSVGTPTQTRSRDGRGR